MNISEEYSITKNVFLPNILRLLGTFSIFLCNIHHEYLYPIYCRGLKTLKCFICGILRTNFLHIS